MGFEFLYDSVELSVEGHIHAEFSDNSVISVLDDLKILSEVNTASCLFTALIKHICDLDIVKKTLSGSRRNNVLSLFVALDYGSNFSELTCVSETASAEFNNLISHIYHSLLI